MIDRRFARPAALLVALAFTVGAAACGDSDDGGSSDDAGAAQGDGQAQSAASAKADIAQLMKRLRESYNDTDGRAFCSDLTAKGVREMNDWAATVPKFPDDCPGFIAAYAALFVDNDSPDARARQEGDRGWRPRHGDDARRTSRHPLDRHLRGRACRRRVEAGRSGLRRRHAANPEVNATGPRPLLRGPAPPTAFPRRRTLRGVRDKRSVTLRSHSCQPSHTGQTNRLGDDSAVE